MLPRLVWRMLDTNWRLPFSSRQISHANHPSHTPHHAPRTTHHAPRTTHPTRHTPHICFCFCLFCSLHELFSRHPLLKEEGIRFVELVTKLMERLLDYRTVISVDDNIDNRMSCTVNVLVSASPPNSPPSPPPLFLPSPPPPPFPFPRLPFSSSSFSFPFSWSSSSSLYLPSFFPSCPFFPFSSFHSFFTPLRLLPFNILFLFCQNFYREIGREEMYGR